MSQPSKAGEIKVTPLYGGDESLTSNGVCTLLEIGSAKILLDCGSSSPPRYDVLEYTRDYLLSIGGVDAIILSHADIHHAGGLHVIAGRKGLRARVYCTYPVFSLAQLVLYDHVLNLRMEGEKLSEEEEEVEIEEEIEEEVEDDSVPMDEASGTSSPKKKTVTRVVRRTVKRKKPVQDHASLYDLDDVDQAFSSHTLLKFSQSIEIFNRRKSPVFLSSVPSGRTLGGAIWKIRNGPAEIVYAMDINLKKELLLDGLDLNLFSSVSPTLLITDGSGMNPIHSTDSLGSSSASASGLPATIAGKKNEKNDFLNEVLGSLRQNNTVLVPTETSSRTLELLLTLNKHWQEQKLTQYPVFFLSHMSVNVVELCQCNLEWMSGALVKNFYSGKLNPFDLSHVKMIKNIKNLEKNFPGAKLILSSDASLSYGFSKELLLKYGGDPKFKVIFCDYSDENSLAHELRVMEKSKPIITTISSPLRVELAGEELAEYNRKEAQKKKAQELELQKKKRQDELSLLKMNEGGLGSNGESKKSKRKCSAPSEGGEGHRTDEEASESDVSDEDSEVEAEGESDPGTSSSSSASANTLATKKMKLGGNSLEFFSQDFYFFDTRAADVTVTDYGLANNDLAFQNINSAENKFLVKDAGKKIETGPLQTSSVTSVAQAEAEVAPTTSGLSEKSKPWKLISTYQKFQLTCKFKSFNLSGRNDFKNVKALINKVAPQKVLLLRSSKETLAPLISYIKASSHDSIDILNSSNFTTNLFHVNKEKIIVQIARNFIPASTKKIFLANSIGAAGTAAASACSVSVLQGAISMQELMGDEGTKLLKFLGEVPIEEAENSEEEMETDGVEVTPETDADKKEDDKKADPLEQRIRDDLDLYLRKQAEKEAPSAATFLPPLSTDSKALVSSSQLGVAVSNGEVTLNSLKLYLEAQGVRTDYQIAQSGGVLILNEQVVIRKDNNNFSIEGPPIPAFYMARKAIYNHCAFI